MNVRLHASEQDADDQADDLVDDQADDNASGQDDAADGETDDQADDNADADADDQQDGGDKSEDDQLNARAAIARRAREAKPEPIDPVRLAAETASATARTLADAQSQATRAAAEEARETEALAGMNDEQKGMYLLAKKTRGLEQSQQQTHLLLHSNNDQISFGRVLSRKPQFQKFEAEVDRRHNDILAKGGFTSREVILAHLIGERALKAEHVEGQKKQAQRRMQNERGGNNSGRAARGDAGGGQKNSQRASLVSRMERDDAVI